MANREETNFNRLLHRCQAMASAKQFDDWRLEKYVGTLQEYLQKMRTSTTNKPQQEILAEYTRKVDFLKGLLEAEKLPSSSERLLAADLLTPGHRSSDAETPSKDIHLQTKARYQRDARDDLMGNKKLREQNGVRQRKTSGNTDVVPPWRVQADDTSNATDLDTVIKYQQEMQEKLAEEMVSLTRNMKENATVAHKLVQDDNKKLTDSNQIADKNFGKLKVESERLEKHVQKFCNWWLWIMLAAVCLVFMWMVVFMRIFPKR